jgi:hypothetical protein
MLSGVVYSGWQMARAALACVDKLDGSDAFYRQKFATCVFFAAYVLPRSEALAVNIVHGELVSAYAKQVEQG